MGGAIQSAIARWLYEHALVATCAVQVGVSERALEITAGYVREREQFGVPIGSFQAVQHRCADAFIDVEAIRWSTWRAAWRLAEGLPAAREAAVAKFWAAEGGSRIADAAQHLHGGLGVGDELPPLDVELSAASIVGGALASRDFTPVHHSRAAAQAQGMADVFMNILTTNGYVGRYVTDWAGVDAIVKNVAIKLGAPNVVGDTMKMAGKVVATEPDEGIVVVEVAGRNSWGNHVEGTVRVALPAGA